MISRPPAGADSRTVPPLRARSMKGRTRINGRRYEGRGTHVASGKGINCNIHWVIYTPTAREVNGKRDTPRGPKSDPVVSPPSSEQKRRGYPENTCINTWYKVDWGEKSVESDGGWYAVKANWELVRVASKVLQIDADGCRANGENNQGDYKSKSP